MNTKEWVAVHRKHHDTVETDKDPHSPWIHGVYKVLFLGAFLYRTEACKEETLRRYGQGTPDDWMESNVYNHVYLGIFLMLAINVALFGALAGALIWGVQMVWIPFWAAGVINGLGHWFGYRNFDTEEGSTNLFPWAVWIGGEELHNNHHAYANSAKFSQRPWEIDIGWLYIKAFEAFGLIKVKRVMPTATIGRSVPSKILDMTALQTILANRQLVMANYCKEVVRRVCNEEIEKVTTGAARDSLRKVRRLALCDNELFMSRQMLDSAGAMVQLVYRHKERLRELWNKRAGTASEKSALLEDLRKWQTEAINSGVQALSDFAVRLPGYQKKLYQAG